MKVLVVGNPIAGSGRGERLINEVAHRLESMECEVDVIKTRRKGDAREAASQCRADRIVSVGGDGTINEIVNGLSGRDTPVAVVPAGVGNVLVRELALSRDIETICRAVCEGREIAMDACTLGKSLFLLTAGIGFDAHVVHDVAASRRGTLGYISYLLPVISSWARYTPEPFSVEVDGSRICRDTVFCVIGNVRNYIGSWKMLPAADPTDGLLDVLLFRGTKTSNFTGFAVSFALQRHLSRGDVICVRGRTVRAFSSPHAQVPVHADGDPTGYLPIDVVVAPHSVRIIA